MKPENAQNRSDLDVPDKQELRRFEKVIIRRVAYILYLADKDSQVMIDRALYWYRGVDKSRYRQNNFEQAALEKMFGPLESELELLSRKVGGRFMESIIEDAQKLLKIPNGPLKDFLFDI